MPWNTTCQKKQRAQFIIQYQRRKTTLAELCRRWQISRKTAYKWLGRFNQEGRRGLRDRKRAARKLHNRPSRLWLDRLRRWRQRHPSWGAPKLYWALVRRFGKKGVPSESSIGRWLRAWDLTRKGRRRVRKGTVLPRPDLTEPREANDVWTVDFKGWFRTGDGRRVDPLTVRDLASRYVLAIQLMEGQRVLECRQAFARLFSTYGLPRVIRADNGAPFGSTGALGLTRLSVWWVKLGIKVEFIDPGHPEQNGAHEQLHSVYAKETLRPPAFTVRAQKERSRLFIQRYNNLRPHEGLGMKVPAELYQKNSRHFNPTHHHLLYPAGWLSRRIKGKGMINLHGQIRFIGEAFEGERVGLKQADANTWEVYFGQCLIGKLPVGGTSGIAAVCHERKRLRK